MFSANPPSTERWHCSGWLCSKNILPIRIMSLFYILECGNNLMEDETITELQ